MQISSISQAQSNNQQKQLSFGLSRKYIEKHARSAEKRALRLPGGKELKRLENAIAFRDFLSDLPGGRKLVDFLERKKIISTEGSIERRIDKVSDKYPEADELFYKAVGIRAYTPKSSKYGSL